jgi:hypothetical protein
MGHFVEQLNKRCGASAALCLFPFAVFANRIFRVPNYHLIMHPTTGITALHDIVPAADARTHLVARIRAAQREPPA